MKQPHNIMETPEMSPAKGNDGQSIRRMSTRAKVGNPAAEPGTIPILEWAGTDAYTVIIHCAIAGNSTAFRLSF